MWNMRCPTACARRARYPTTACSPTSGTCRTPSPRPSGRALPGISPPARTMSSPPCSTPASSPATPTSPDGCCPATTSSPMRRWPATAMAGMPTPPILAISSATPTSATPPCRQSARQRAWCGRTAPGTEPGWPGCSPQRATTRSASPARPGAADCCRCGCSASAAASTPTSSPRCAGQPALRCPASRSMPTRRGSSTSASAAAAVAAPHTATPSPNWQAMACWWSPPRATRPAPWRRREIAPGC